MSHTIDPQHAHAVTGRLDGKIAVVTGAAKGLGAAIVERFSAEGATVVGADITPSDDRITCDVTDESQVEALIAETIAKHGKLDVMVSCAGVATVNPIVQMSLEEWRHVLSVDLDGVFLTTKHAGAAMAAAGGGVILNIASIKAFGGAPATAHYGAAKAGVVSLSKTAAMELRAFNVRVNAICPGWVDTDMVNDRKAELEAVLGLSFDEYIAHVQGRLGEPDEVAGVAAFLASDRAAFTSGGAYVVDGGATASLV
jgi:NAD(P)-dependent dehydrogenase (short-subunit alcohol dehydrogenase family)